MQKLRWRSRRGMRELDVLLTRFIDQRFNSLSNEAQDDFERLLEQSDIDLYRWLTGRSLAPDASFAQMIDEIRACES